MRAFRGYGNINQQLGRGWRTFHSLQLAFNRRFSNGVSFGFNDTITLYDHQSTNARLQHNADGTYIDPQRPGAGRRAAGHDDQPGARAEGQLRVGHAGPDE